MSREADPAANDTANDTRNDDQSSNYAPSSYAPSVIEESPPAYPPSNYAPSSYAPSSYAPSEVELATPPPLLGRTTRPPASRSSGSAGFDKLISTLRGVPEVKEVAKAPESTYAESVYCVARPTLPSASELPSNHARNKPHTENKLKERYYKVPPASRRAPVTLHNQHCGAKYKTVAAIRRVDALLFKKLVNSEQMVVMQVLAGIYFYRMNSIPGKNMLSDAAIRGMFDCDITDFQFSINELYKRLALRKGRVNSAVGDYNFWLLSIEEMDRFRDWLKRIGTWRDGVYGAIYTLWTFGKDSSGKIYLKLKLNDATLNWIQLLNCMYDSLSQWTKMFKGAAYIQGLGTSDELAFDFC